MLRVSLRVQTSRPSIGGNIKVVQVFSRNRPDLAKKEGNEQVY